MTDQVYDTLLNLILTRDLQPGHMLEERRLAERLAVSRTPLRAALNRLEGEGLVSRLSNGALAVKEVGITEFLEILHLRRILESEAAYLAAGRIPGPELEAVRGRITDLMGKEAPTVSEHWAVDDDLHELVAGASGNGLLASAISDLRRAARMCNVERSPARLMTACQEHLRIVEALATADPGKGRAAMSAHLESVKAGLLQDLGRL